LGDRVVDHSLPGASLWGYEPTPITPSELVEQTQEQTTIALREYQVLPLGPEPCNDCAGYHRASVLIPLTHCLFDQLMNGSTGYHAHYYVSVMCGEMFNRHLVNAVAPLVVENESLYSDKFARDFCERSLLGRFSKFWFPKEITDPSAQMALLELDEVLSVPRWGHYWRTRPKPWKGLLAPIPENSAVLLNGTFIDTAGDYEQKPGRSKQIFDSGWT
jgi:hypothetical protein